MLMILNAPPVVLFLPKCSERTSNPLESKKSTRPMRILKAVKTQVNIAKNMPAPVIAAMPMPLISFFPSGLKSFSDAMIAMSEQHSI